MSSGGSNESELTNLVAAILKNSLDACRAEGGSPVFRTPESISSTSFRSWLFSNLKSDLGRKRMDDVLIRLGGAPVSQDLSHAYRDYIRARWFPVAVCVLAIVVFVISLILSCTINKRFRRFLRKKCCAEPESSSTISEELPPVTDHGAVTETKFVRAKLSSIQYRNQIVVLLLSIFLCLSVWVIVGFGIQGAISLVESQRVISCNMWLEFYGYYNGAPALVPESLMKSTSIEEYANLANLNINEGASGRELTARVTTDWLGSIPLSELLRDLANQTQLTTDNPLYQNFTENRALLQTDLEAYEAKVDEYLDAVDAYISVYDAALALLKTKLRSIATFGKWDASYSFIFSLKKVYLSKKDVFKKEVETAAKAAWPILDELIEKYVGTSSSLMKKANDAVHSALSSVEMINHSMKEMYEVWKPMNVKLRAGVIALLVLAAVASLSAIVATALAVHMTSHIIRRSRQSEARQETLRSQASLEEDIHEEKLHRSRCWLWASIFCGIALALSALLVGVCFVTSAIGADACESIDVSLMTSGQWDLLGKKILYPPATQNRTLDMKPVLDTCIKRSSGGSIAKTLGLDASVAEVSDDVLAAVDDINGTRDRILLKNSRHMRVEIIGFLMKELLRGLSHETHFKSDGLLNQDRVPSFNELQEINFENHTTTTEGRRTLLAPIPYWPTLVTSITGHGILYVLGTIVDAYIMLNAISDLAFTNNPDSQLPRFCGALARKRKLACSYYVNQEGDSRPIADLSDYETNDQSVVDGWLKTIDADIPTYGQYSGQLSSRMRQLIGATIYVEAAANYDAETLGLIGSDEAVGSPVCVDEMSSEIACTFDDARQFHQEELNGVWQNLTENYESMIARVDTYVDDLVIPTSQDLVRQAEEVIISSNCQFQGSQLDNLVYAPLCWTFFPNFTMLTLLAFALFCAMLVIQIILWSCDTILNNYLGQDYLPAKIVYTSHNRRRSSVQASKENIPGNTLLVPSNQRSLSSASYQDSVRQYGSESFVPIFAPLRVHHYN